MTTVSSSVTADAVILGQRNRHSLDRDHFGAIDARRVVITEPIGPWDVHTPVSVVFSEIMDRIIRLESAALRFGSVTADAYIWPYFIRADAVIFGTVAGSITADARVAGGGSITADAVIDPNRHITADAVIV